jgi:hypothetical protein
MEGFAVVFVFIGLMVAAVVFSVARAQAKRANVAWRNAARMLGLPYQPGGMLSPRRIEGSLPGGYVIVNTFTRRSGKHSRTYTRYRVRYHQPLGLGLKLTKEGFFSGVGKFFGSQDIETGDPLFDSEVVVKGVSGRHVREFLTPARQMRIRRALNAFSGLVIDDDQICWESRSVPRESRHIVNNIRRLTELARSLSGHREADGALDRAVSAQREGRLEDALEAVRDIPVTDEVEPLEARLLEGEILHLAGRDEEASRVFEKAREEAPEDAEIREWADHTAGRHSRGGGPLPPPLPIEKSPDPPPLPSEEIRTAAPEEPPSAPPPETPPEATAPEEPAPEEPVVATPAQSAPPADATTPAPPLDAASVCEDLFRPGQSSLAASRTFEERYEGRAVSWQGKLTSVEGFTYDFVFGSQRGTKAILEVHEVTSDVYGPTKAQAVLQLPPEAREELRESVGGTFTFEGELLKADGLMRNVYVKNAKILAD